MFIASFGKIGKYSTKQNLERSIKKTNVGKELQSYIYYKICSVLIYCPPS